MKKIKPRHPPFRLRVRKSRSGFGLFVEEDIPRNRFIVEYWGELVNDEEAQRRGGRYLFELENGKTIVGTTRENIARYANHSCRPNSEVRIKGNRVFLFSLRHIHAGEEISYDYGKEYFDYYIKPSGCTCVKCSKP